MIDFFPFSCRPTVVAFFAGVMVASSQAQEFDPLALQSAPVEKIEVQSPVKLFVEGAAGTSSRRYQLGRASLRRLSLDLNYSDRIASDFRIVVSNRIDYLHPVAAGADSTVNSLREAYLSWQPEGGDNIFDAGRINIRNGPGYGYNPTDFFRDNSLRTLTTANPFALRENRLGTVVFRGQQLWAGGSLSIAYSPKLSTRSSADGWSLDLGATNNRDRGLIMLGTQFSERLSTQLLAYKESGLSPKIGASMTALVSDAATAYAEWSRGSEPDLLSRALGSPGASSQRNRFAGGVTYTTQGKLSITLEYQYNGAALDKPGWETLGASPAAQIAYLQFAQRQQDLSSRRAYLIYVTQKDLGLKNLDLTAFVRYNVGDHSKLAWVELRHHWANFDLAVQLQRNIGRITSEFGVLPERRVIQVLGSYFF